MHQVTCLVKRWNKVISYHLLGSRITQKRALAEHFEAPHRLLCIVATD